MRTRAVKKRHAWTVDNQRLENLKCTKDLRKRRLGRKIRKLIGQLERGPNKKKASN